MVLYCFDGLVHLVLEPVYCGFACLRLLCIFVYGPAFYKSV